MKKINVAVTANDLFRRNGKYQKEVNAILRGFATSYKLKKMLNVMFKDGDFVGYTDGSKTVLNPFNSFFSEPKVPLNVQAVYVLGVAAHELAHCIYTGFAEVLEEQDSIEKGTIKSRPVLTGVEETNLREIEEFIGTPSGAETMIPIYHELHNILEDGFIEEHFIADFGGGDVNNLSARLANALDAVRLHQFYDNTPVDDVLSKVHSKWAFTTGMMLSYAKYGKFLHRDDSVFDDPLFDYVKRVYDVIDRYVEGPRGHQEEKLAMIWEIIAKLWDILKPEAEEAAAKREAMKELMEQIKSAMGSMASGEGGSGSGTPITINVDWDDDEEGENSGSSSGSEDSESENSSGSSGGDGEEKSEKNGSEDKNDGEGNSSKSSESDGEKEASERSKAAKKTKARDEGVIDDNAPKAEISSEEGRRIDTEGVEGNVDNSSREGESTQGIREHISDAELENVNRLIKDLRKEMEISAANEAITQEKQLEARNMTLKENIHRGIAFKLNRISDISEEMVYAYNQDAETVLSISKKAQKALAKKLKNRTKSIKTTGVTGKKLEVSRLHRTDMTYFSTKSVPNKMPPMALAVLVDESGSMCCGNRVPAAKAASIIIEDLCRGLDIPCAIYGHWTSRSYVEIDEFKSFEDVDKKDRYRLENITADGANRDGAAIYYVGEQLKKRAEINKMLIVISDGQPSDTGYYGSAAEEDTRNAKIRLTKAGVKVFAAAIGSDKENIERIYGDGFMDISNLDALPEILTKLIVKNIKA